MNDFSSFNIKPRVKSFVGDKISIKRVFDVEISVLDYKIEPSKKKEGTNLLTIQIIKNKEKRIIFTGSTVLIDMIKRVPKDGFPFKTKIINENERYEFT